MGFQEIKMHEKNKKFFKKVKIFILK